VPIIRNSALELVCTQRKERQNVALVMSRALTAEHAMAGTALNLCLF